MEFRLGEDYYVEDGLIIMTATFHLKRGMCCGNGCRHCPYAPQHKGGVTTIADEHKPAVPKTMLDGET
jgi:hypothetical protein